MAYSEKVMDHFANPRNVGEIENADGVGEVGNAKCGDIMKMYLKIKDNKIETVVVSNGKILQNSLNLCEKEKDYVKKILEKKNIKQNNVFLMTLDALGNYNIIKKE